MALSDNMRGALLMMTSMTAFTVNDIFMKSLSDELPLFESIFIRGVLITIGLLVFARVRGHLRYRAGRKDWVLIGLRTFAEAASTVLFLTALGQMKVANLSAILQSLPLTVTLAAAIFLREPVGWRRMTAILVGFVGVLLIVRPGTEGFNIYALLGIGAVLLVTLRDLSVRRLSRDVPSGLVALAASIGVTAMAAFGALGGNWIRPDMSELLRLAGASGFLMIGYIAAVSAMRVGEIGFVAPFRYTSLVVALLLGFMIFDEWPETLTLLGAGIVVATGLFTLYRERRTARKVPIGLRIR